MHRVQKTLKPNSNIHLFLVFLLNNVIAQDSLSHSAFHTPPVRTHFIFIYHRQSMYKIQDNFFHVCLGPKQMFLIFENKFTFCCSFRARVFLCVYFSRFRLSIDIFFFILHVCLRSFAMDLYIFKSKIVFSCSRIPIISQRCRRTKKALNLNE